MKLKKYFRIRCTHCSKMFTTKYKTCPYCRRNEKLTPNMSAVLKETSKRLRTARL